MVNNLYAALRIPPEGIECHVGPSRATARLRYRPWLATASSTAFKALTRLATQLLKNPDCPTAVRQALESNPRCQLAMTIENPKAGFFELFNAVRMARPELREETYHRFVNEFRGWPCVHPTTLLQLGRDGQSLIKYVRRHEVRTLRLQLFQDILKDPSWRANLWCPVCRCFPFPELAPDPETT